MSMDVSTNRLLGTETSLARITPAQRTAAKLAGFLYLIQMASGVFGEIFVRRQLMVRGDAMQTFTNIAASERLFRTSIVTDLLTYATVILLAWALYVVLKPINRNVALLAVFWRLAENALAAGTVAFSFVALRLFANTDYLRVFDGQQLAVLARLFLGGQGAGLGIAFIFCGLGTAAFSYLWLKSRYIPRALAAWGIFSSLLLSVGGLTVMVFPRVGTALGLTYMMPMGIYEVGLGLWLLFMGLREPRLEQAGSSR